MHRCTTVLLAALALFLPIAAAAEAATGTAPAPALGLHSGKDDSIEQYEAFGAWLGNRVIYRVVFSDMRTWDGIASPWYIGTTRRWLASDPGRVEVISLPLLPKTDAGDFAAVAAGRHDRHFRAFATKLAERGIASRVIVRLGWEGNGDWYPWAYGRDPDGFRKAFRRAAQVMRRAAPGLRFEWCVACRASRKGGPAEWTEAYPGDDVVDIISMDVYDEHEPNWKSLVEGEAGLRELRAFARERGKPEAYPEWGCSTNRSARGRGDNPEFIENMARWFAEGEGRVLYQAYWNTSSGGPNAAIHGPALSVPNAARAFRRVFGMGDTVDLQSNILRRPGVVTNLSGHAPVQIPMHGPLAATSGTEG